MIYDKNKCCKKSHYLTLKWYITIIDEKIFLTVIEISNSGKFSTET